jgi:VIT1/CCC1 family predicted Fe2+/Mn2+ transporter
VASVLQPAELESMRERLARVPDPQGSARLGAEDWKGALGIFLLVFTSTLPVVVPFLFFHEAHHALRVSNAVAVSMLFVCGYATGRLTRYHPWGMGVGMVLLGLALVGMTMALGG